MQTPGKTERSPVNVHPPRRGGTRRVVINVLSDHERSEAELVARRLHGEVRELVRLLPTIEQPASAMSRALALDRATCQRIVATVLNPSSSPETLVQLPGVLGLRQFVHAMSEHPAAKGDHERLSAVSAAIDRFESFLERIGGSQRLLRMRLEASAPGAATIEPDGVDDVRASLIRSASAITGRCSETTVHTAIIRPLPDDPKKTESVRIRGLIGHTWTDQAIPLEIGESAALQHNARAEPAFATLDAMPASGNTPNSLLAPFCSSPLPRVISRATQSRVVHVIDASDGGTGPVDIVTAHRGTAPDLHPAALRPALGEIWALQNFPAKRLVFDTFLHRDIACRCIPSVEVHLWTPGVNVPGSSRWSTRFPGGPRLEVLGPDFTRAQTTGYERYVELLSHVFTQLNWRGEEFVGYRCEVPFPVWRAGYCMIFDFTGNELPAD